MQWILGVTVYWGNNNLKEKEVNTLVLFGSTFLKKLTEMSISPFRTAPPSK